MAIETTETPRATANVTSLQAYREAKATPAVETTPKPEEKTAPPSEQTTTVESGSAAAPEAPTQETQLQGKPRRNSAEGRADELSAQGRYDEARKILEAKDRKHSEEIATLKRKLEERAALEERAPSKPAAEETTAKTDSGAPKLKDFLAKPENKDKAYDEVVEQWEDAKYDWRRGTEAARAENDAHTKTVNEKISEGRAKHGADFDAALKVQLHIPNLHALVNDFDNGMDVLMSLHQDPAEHARIFALTPARQLAELAYISRDLKAAAKAAETPSTEKPKLVPPVSRSTPPARSLAGGMASAETQRKTPGSLAEHRANRAAK